MIRRTLDGRFLTRVANHPSVRPHLRGEGPLNLVETVSNVANVALETDGGGWLLIATGPGVYDVHSLFLPEARGGHVRAALRHALCYMFTQTDCTRLTTLLPAENPAARALGRMAGFRPWFQRAGDQFSRIELDDWIQASPDCEQAAQRVAVAMDMADPAGLRALGAAVMMWTAGNPIKATHTFNAWATAAGNAPMRLLTLTPALGAIGDVVFQGANMEAIQCQPQQ